MFTCEDDGNNLERTVAISNGDEGELFFDFLQIFLARVPLRFGEEQEW